MKVIATPFAPVMTALHVLIVLRTFHIPKQIILNAVYLRSICSSILQTLEPLTKRVMEILMNIMPGTSWMTDCCMFVSYVKFQFRLGHTSLSFRLGLSKHRVYIPRVVDIESFMIWNIFESQGRCSIHDKL